MSPSTLRLDIRFAQEAQDVAGYAGQPESGGYEPESGCGRLGGAERIPVCGCEGCWESLKVNQVGDVFKGLVEDVGEALGEGDGVQVVVYRGGGRGLRGREEKSEPRVERDEGGEAEGCARVSYEGGKVREVGWSGWRVGRTWLGGCAWAE
jgi:hypothetical protein